MLLIIINAASHFYIYAEYNKTRGLENNRKMK